MNKATYKQVRALVRGNGLVSAQRWVTPTIAAELNSIANCNKERDRLADRAEAYAQDEQVPAYQLSDSKKVSFLLTLSDHVFKSYKR